MGIRSTYLRVNCLNLFVACTKLNIVNEQISVALADLGKGDSRLAPTDLQEIEYNCQTDDSSSALWLDMDSQSGTGTCTTDGDSSRLVNEPETSDDSQTVNYLYNCPVCDQIQTMTLLYAENVVNGFTLTVLGLINHRSMLYRMKCHSSICSVGQRHVNHPPIDHRYKCHESTNHSHVPQLSKAHIPTSKWKYVPNLLQT